MARFKIFINTVWGREDAISRENPVSTSINQRKITTTNFVTPRSKPDNHHREKAITITPQHHKDLHYQQVFDMLSKNTKSNYYQQRLSAAKKVFESTAYCKNLDLIQRKQVLKVIDMISQPREWNDSANETAVNLLPTAINRVLVVIDINNPGVPHHFNDHIISHASLAEPAIYLLRKDEHYTALNSPEIDIAGDGDCFYKAVASQLPYYINESGEVIIYKPLMTEALRCDLALFILRNLPISESLQEVISSINTQASTQ